MPRPQDSFDGRPYMYVPLRTPGSDRDPPPPYIVFPESHPSTGSPDDFRLRPNCRCLRCREAEEEYFKLRKEVRALSSPQKIFRVARALVVVTFVLILAWKLVTRVNPIAIITTLVSDVLDALFEALRFVFLWPLKLAGRVPGWLFREFKAFLKDVWTALGFITVFTSIALRLAGAYVLFWYVTPIALLVCVVWPLGFIFGGAQKQKERTRSTPTGSLVVAALLVLLAERGRSEYGAAPRVTRSGGGRGRNRRGR